VAGDFNTGFIAEHYAKGFRAEDVPHDDPDFLVALAAACYRATANAPPASAASCQGTACRWASEFVVVVLGAGRPAPHVPVQVDDFVGESGSSSCRSARSATGFASNWHLGDCASAAPCNGQPSPRRSSATAQCWPCASHNGTAASTRMVMSPRAAELLR
jgi:propionyl-CoA carboxylase alpha chain